MSNARIQFSLSSENVWNAYNPQLKEGEIVTVLKANKKVKLVQGKVGGSTYSESTVIWDEDLAETTMSRAEAAAVTATTQANAASGSASKAAASQAAAATSATNAKASENAAANSETNAKASATAAKNSATSAASSASTASTQAGKAADSAAAAAGSAAQAGTFATTATDKATAADKSATAADKSATAADKSATAAAASAVTASDKASEAATSATNAAVSATSAAGAAAEAQGLISKAEYGFLQRNTAYKVGDIAYTTQLPAGYYLECVTAGTTGNAEPTFKVGVILDGTAEFIAVDARAAAIFDLIYPVGSIFATTGNAPARGTWEEIAKGRTLQGADSGHAAGTTIEAGLPNITGNMAMTFGYTSDNHQTPYPIGAVSVSGVFSTDSKWGRMFTPEFTRHAMDSEFIYSAGVFDASNSNAIYGASSTVQPPAYVVHFYRRTA